MTKATTNFKPTGIKGITVNWSKDVAPLEKYLREKGWEVKVERTPTEGDNFDHEAFLSGNLIFQTPCLATVWTWLWALAYGHVYDPELPDEDNLAFIDEHIGGGRISELEAKVAQLEKQRDELIDQTIALGLALDEYPSQADLHRQLYKHPFFTPEGSALVKEWAQMLIDAANLYQATLAPVDTAILLSGDAGKMAGVLSRYLPTIQWILLQRKEQKMLQATPWPIKK